MSRRPKKKIEGLTYDDFRRQVKEGRVEPVYLFAEESDIPQLKRVIVAHGDKVAMEPTLDEAVRAVLGKPAPEPEGVRERETAPPQPGMISTVREHIEQAEAALSRGDWAAFGAAMEGLKRATEPAEAVGAK